MTEEFQVAHHEAAHAIVQYRTSGSAGGSATVVPDHKAGIAGAVTDFVTDSGSPDAIRHRILSLYAGGCADTMNGCYHPVCCASDEADALALLYEWSWETQEQEFRSRAKLLVNRHWKEIVAVANELLQRKKLDETEIEIIADIAAGEPGAKQHDLNMYRSLLAASA